MCDGCTVQMGYRRPPDSVAADFPGGAFNIRDFAYRQTDLLKSAEGVLLYADARARPDVGGRGFFTVEVNAQTIASQVYNVAAFLPPRSGLYVWCVPAEGAIVDKMARWFGLRIAVGAKGRLYTAPHAEEVRALLEGVAVGCGKQDYLSRFNAVLNDLDPPPYHPPLAIDWERSSVPRAVFVERWEAAGLPTGYRA